MAAVLFSFVLAVCTIPLAGAGALTDLGNVVQISYGYLVRNSYSSIRLQCLDNSSLVALPGPSFQLNGTDIRQNVDDTDYLLTLMQSNEGFFTCSWNGVISYNTIGFAGKS